MNNEELLHEYFDDGLDEQREMALFAALAHDGELRREFNDYVSLRSVMQSEAAQNTPPAALSASVFAGLGYALSTPASGEQTPVSGRAGSRKLTSYLPYIFTAAVSSLVTTLVLLLLLRPEVPTAVQASIPPAATGEQQSVSSNAGGQPAGQNIGREAYATVLSSGRDRNVVPVEPAQEHDNPVPVTAAEENDDNSDTRTAIENVPLRHAEAALLQIPEQIVPAVRMTESTDQTPVDRYSVDIDIRGIAARSFPAVDLPTQTTSRLTDIAVTTLYRLSENEAAGISFGREAFGQEYRLMRNSDGVTVRQNPTLWWGGATYRLELPEMAVLPEVLYPYTQPTLAISEIGPLGRLLLGLCYVPEERISLSLGVEGSMLAYPVDGQWYITNKLGLTYGISVRL